MAATLKNVVSSAAAVIAKAAEPIIKAMEPITNKIGDAINYVNKNLAYTVTGDKSLKGKPLIGVTSTTTAQEETPDSPGTIYDNGVASVATEYKTGTTKTIGEKGVLFNIDSFTDTSSKGTRAGITLESFSKINVGIYTEKSGVGLNMGVNQKGITTYTGFNTDLMGSTGIDCGNYMVYNDILYSTEYSTKINTAVLVTVCTATGVMISCPATIPILAPVLGKTISSGGY